MSGKMWAGVHGICVLVCLVRCGLEYTEFVLCLSMSGKMWAGVHGI